MKEKIASILLPLLTLALGFAASPFFHGRLKSWTKAKIKRLTATTSKTAIAVLSAVILILVISVSLFESVRFFCWEHPGILIVVIAVAGEVICDWNRKKTLKERLKKFFGMLLVGGLLLEVAEAIKSDKKVATANLEAKQAEQYAGDANERAAITESNNLALQAKVEQLQARRIGIDQEKIFIDSLKNCPLKTPVKIFEGERDGETDDYANEIRTILDAAQYGSGKSNDITELGDIRFPNRIGVAFSDSPFFLIIYATNNDNDSMWIPGVKITTITNSDSSVLGDFADFGNTISSALPEIDAAFNKIGISPFSIPNNTMVKPGEWGIFVPKKF